MAIEILGGKFIIIDEYTINIEQIKVIHPYKVQGSNTNTIIELVDGSTMTTSYLSTVIQKVLQKYYNKKHKL